MVGAGSPLTREASGPIPVASRRPTGTRLGTPPGDRPQCYPTEASVNLAWVVDAAGLAKTLALPGATLINDLEASAYGVAALEPGDVAVLNPGADGAAGNMAVIAAGTGLGEAGLAWDGRRHQPFPTEG